MKNDLLDKILEEVDQLILHQTTYNSYSIHTGELVDTETPLLNLKETIEDENNEN